MTVFSWQVALAYIILAPFIGGFMTGLDRKISARMQGRRGPSVLQPFYDVSKLMQKETKMVNHLQQFMVSGFLVFVAFTGALFFWGGDLLLVFFSLTLAGIFYVLTASCANAPFSSLAAQRELLQMMAYEPMVLLAAIGFYLATGSFQVREIAATSMSGIVVLPGFFFKTLAGNGTLVNIDVSTLSIYFTYSQDDTTYVGIQRVAATEEVLQNNQVDNRNMEKLVNSPDYTMLKTPAGIVTEVTLPIDAIYAGHETDSVNSAKIVFMRQNNNEKSTYSLNIPKNILMVRTGEMNDFFANHKLPDSKTSYSTSYSSEYNSYTFSNLANLVSVMKNERDSGAGVKATDPETLRTQKRKAWEKEHPDWNKVYLVPISTVTSNLGAITNVHNQFDLTSTKLVGGANNPLKISIVYSHFK